MRFLAFNDVKFVYGKFQENPTMGKRLRKFTISPDSPFRILCVRFRESPLYYSSALINHSQMNIHRKKCVSYNIHMLEY